IKGVFLCHIFNRNRRQQLLLCVMKLFYRILFVCAFSIHFGNVFSQDTSSFVFYNLLQFPNEKPNRITHLKTIVKELNPDVFMVCELSNNAGSVTILNQALNTDGVNYYQRATFWNDGSLNNMLYYNTRKYKLLDQDVIDCQPRFATVYKLVDKDALNAGDSIISTFVVVHLKAGNGSSDNRSKESAAKMIREYIDEETNGENIFLSGDFNIYSPSEGAFKEFTERGVNTFNDPVNEIGEWSNTEYYAPLHTQSTRTTSFGSGSAGGLDDRFDWILVSDDVVNGTNKMEYVLGSYKAFGNDGKHFNNAINFKENTAVRDEVADALHEMSDHLPVVMKVANTFTNSVVKQKLVQPYSVVYNGSLIMREVKQFDYFEVIDINGRIVESSRIAKGNETVEISTLNINSLYLVRLLNSQEVVTLKARL
ncbi:MAG: endonuclease/exonuclease/phosphatase family protein, partial [Bacteroidia bacterium]